MIAIDLGRVIQVTGGVLMTSLLVANALIVNGVVFAQLLGIARIQLFPEELFSLWALSVLTTIVTTVFVAKKGWNWI